MKNKNEFPPKLDEKDYEEIISILHKKVDSSEHWRDILSKDFDNYIRDAEKKDTEQSSVIFNANIQIGNLHDQLKLEKLSKDNYERRNGELKKSNLQFIDKNTELQNRIELCERENNYFRDENNRLKNELNSSLAKFKNSELEKYILQKKIDEFIGQVKE